MIKKSDSTTDQLNVVDYNNSEQENAQLIFEIQKWLTTKEAAALMRKSVNAIHILISRGHLRPRKFRNRLYFNRRELNDLIETSYSNGGFNGN